MPRVYSYVLLGFCSFQRLCVDLTTIKSGHHQRVIRFSAYWVRTLYTAAVVLTLTATMVAITNVKSPTTTVAVQQMTMNGERAYCYCRTAG